MPGSTYSQETIDHDKAVARRTSKVLFNSSVAGFTGGVLLLISFCSPYWIQSWADTASPFINMGLWEACFFRFRYPSYQLDKLFTGCASLWGDRYYEIRSWIMPWWLMLVQFFMVINFMSSFMAQIFDVCLLLRWPLERVLRFEYQLTAFSFMLKTFTTALLFLTIALFGGKCWDRDWLMYPNFNYVSWSYAFACFSMVAHGVSSFFMYVEAKEARERREKNMALVMQMYPTPGLFDGSMHTYHGSQFI